MQQVQGRAHQEVKPPKNFEYLALEAPTEMLNKKTLSPKIKVIMKGKDYL